MLDRVEEMFYFAFLFCDLISLPLLLEVTKQTQISVKPKFKCMSEPVGKKVRVELTPATTSAANNSPVDIRGFRDSVPRGGKIKVGKNGASVDAVSVEDLCKVVYDVVQAISLAFVMGSPGCGKTSLAAQLVPFLENQGFTVVSVMSDHLLSKYEDHTQYGKDTNYFFIVDEAHLALQRSGFYTHFIKDKLYKIVLFSTMLVGAEEKVAPQELKDSKMWLFGPSSDRDKVSTYACNVLDCYKLPTDEGARRRVADSLYDMCGGNMNVLSYCLEYVIDSGGCFRSRRPC